MKAILGDVCEDDLGGDPAARVGQRVATHKAAHAILEATLPALQPPARALAVRPKEAPLPALRKVRAHGEAALIQPLVDQRAAPRCAAHRRTHATRLGHLAVYVERLRRLEEIATRFDGIKRAFAVKAGKEIRVIVDSGRIDDNRTISLSKEIARAVEKELSFPGQIKVNVVRETRAVRFAV